MTYAEALKIAEKKLADDGADSRTIDRLTTKRPQKKVQKGCGRGRELAGLTHTRVHVE
jgi:hypothetical protein